MALPVLRDGEIELRPLRRSDENAWLDLRAQSRAWLQPWEASAPNGTTATVTFAAWARSERKAWRQRTSFAAVMVVDGALVGRVSVGGIRWGAERGGSVGYWISPKYAGRGIVPRAVRLLCEYAFAEGLHRLEIAVRPENAASLRVVEKLGFREEGGRLRYLYIDGDWRDHRVFALTADEPRRGLMAMPRG
jgi:ribosomal-protein-alanine N-acetyltransferase